MLTTRRQITALVLTAGLCGSAAACGSEGAEGSEREPTATADPAAPAADGAAAGSSPATVGAVGTDVTGCDPEVSLDVHVIERTSPVAEAAAATLEEQHPGLSVEVTASAITTYQELARQIAADVATGNTPDVVEVGTIGVGFAADILGARAIDPAALPAGYDRDLTAIGTLDGNLYGVPWQVGGQVSYYNLDLLAAAGVDTSTPPTTWDELAEQLRAVTASTDAAGALFLTGDGGESVRFQNFVALAGGRFLDDDHLPAFDTPGVVEAFEALQDLVAEGAVEVAPMQDTFALFAAGEAAAVPLFSSAALGSFDENIGTSFEWAVGANPTVGDVGSPAQAASGSTLAVLAEDDCAAAFGVAFIDAVLESELVVETNARSGYIPVTEAATETALEATYTDRPNWAEAVRIGKDQQLGAWGGWRGPRALEADQIVNDAYVAILSQGQDPGTVIGDAADELRELLG